MKTLTKKIVCVFVLQVLVLTVISTYFAGFQDAKAQFAGIGDLMPRYNEITQAYNYILDTNGTHVLFGNGTSWRYDNITTQANFYAGLNSLLRKGGFSFFARNGSYTIAGQVKYDITNFGVSKPLSFDASNQGAKFSFTTSSSYFNITWKGVYQQQLEDVSFEHFYFEGNNVAPYAVRADMGNRTRLRGFRFYDNKVWDFTQVGVWITNAEENYIQNNIFYNIGKTDLRFNTYYYEVGNNVISGNEILYATSGRNGIQFWAQNYSVTEDAWFSSGVGGFRTWGNHFLGTSNTWAFNMTANGLSITGIQSTSDSVEGGGVFLAKTNTTNGIVKGCSFENGRVTNTVSGVPYLFNLGVQAWSTMISNNPYILNTGSDGGILLDNNTSTSTYNVFANNWVASTSGFSPSPTTYVHDNAGLQSYYTLKTRGTDLISTTSKLTNFGALYSTVTTKTKYTIWTNDVILTVSGGTVTNIIIYDSAGTQIADFGSTCTFVRIPRLDILNVTYTGSPTITFQWVN